MTAKLITQAAVVVVGLGVCAWMVACGHADAELILVPLGYLGGLLQQSPMQKKGPTDGE